MTAALLTFEDFCNSAQDSRQWYDMLPDGRIRIDAVPASPSRDQIIATMLNNAPRCDELMIDILAAHVLNGNDAHITTAQWQLCSEQLSRLMAQNLTANGSRPLRMRAQRLHYYLQHVLAEEAPLRADLVLQEETLPFNKPWDMLSHTTGTWWISSEEQNIHWRDTHGQIQHASHGLPTQLDRVDDAWLSIGSLYSNGCMLTNGHEWQPVMHEAPILLVWQHEGERYFLDHYSAIWHLESRQKIAQFPCTQVHFARMYHGKLYGLNNGEFGAIWVYDLATGTITHPETPGVWVTNDIAATTTHAYLIDKQQGYVFKFDHQWRLMEKVLAFGSGPARLWDPVAIRIANDTIHVISWVNGKHTILQCF